MKARFFPLALLAGALCSCQSYSLRASVSWVVSSNDVVEDADLSEEAAPALLVDNAGGLWKQAYPSSEVPGDGAIKGLPFGNIFSVSDGPLDNSTGVIYFYVTPMDYTVADLKSDPHASLTFSEAEGQFCRQMVYDPEDPRCARLTLTGKMVEVASEELGLAKQAMFSRHPVMAKWPVGHKWFFMKMELMQVWLQDWIGGVSLIPLEDYFKATPF